MTHQQSSILLITDPNGGPPRILKVVGGVKVPTQQSANLSNSSNPSTVKTVFKTSDDQGITFVQGAKVNQHQLVAVPANPDITIQTLKKPGTATSHSIQANSVQQQDQIIQATNSSTLPVIASPGLIIQSSHIGNAYQASGSVPKKIYFPMSNQVLGANNLAVSRISQNATSVANAVKPNPILIVKNENKPTSVPSPSYPGRSVDNALATIQKRNEYMILSRKTKQVENIWQQKETSRSQPQVVNIKTEPQYVYASASPSVTSTKSLINSSILDHGGVRKRHDFDFGYTLENKKRRPDKNAKGLRHFSMKVCEKVQLKGTTTYNEVADELVTELTEAQSKDETPDPGVYDQKNIRRRVYDALNVLMAMDIISKEKKEIKWLGLPTNSHQESRNLELERNKRVNNIKVKTQQLLDLILQQIAFKNLIERNRRNEKENGPPAPNAAIQMPFIIVNTDKKTVIECSISNDKTKYEFSFDDTFEIHDDLEVLKRMGMALGLERGECTNEDLERAKKLVPKVLESYVSDLADGRGAENYLRLNGFIHDSTEDPLQVPETDYNSRLSSATSAISETLHASNMNLEGKEGTFSRHSSPFSLCQDQRTDSGSPSSYGEYDDNFESDIELSIT